MNEKKGGVPQVRVFGPGKGRVFDRISMGRRPTQPDESVLRQSTGLPHPFRTSAATDGRKGGITKISVPLPFALFWRKGGILATRVFDWATSVLKSIGALAPGATDPAAARCPGFQASFTRQGSRVPQVPILGPGIGKRIDRPRCQSELPINPPPILAWRALA